MSKILICLVFLCFSNIYCLADNNFCKKNLLSVDDSVFNGIFDNEVSSNIFILGESHLDDNLKHQLLILHELRKTKQITKIGLEIPFGLTKSCNNFLLNGDNTIFDLISKEYRIDRSSTKKILYGLKCYNSLYVKGNPITVFCFDVSTSSNYSTLKILSNNFKEIKGIKNLELYNYLEEENYTKDYTVLKEMTKKISIDLIKNNKLYKSVLGDLFETYEFILRGMEIAYLIDFPLTKSSNVEREYYIEKAINYYVKSKENTLILCGNLHASKLEGDTLRYKSGFTYFSNLLMKNSIHNIFTIGIEYYRGRLATRLVGDYSALSVSMDNLIDKKEDYKIIHGDNLLLHPEANKRYDMILIKNTRWGR